jgi:hypothetical protein
MAVRKKLPASAKRRAIQVRPKKFASPIAAG